MGARVPSWSSFRCGLATRLRQLVTSLSLETKRTENAGAKGPRERTAVTHILYTLCILGLGLICEVRPPNRIVLVIRTGQDHTFRLLEGSPLEFRPYCTMRTGVARLVGEQPAKPVTRRIARPPRTN